ncbi:MAG TPA: hypothetical protein VE462_08785, partial [Propionibacteriaceae bacterium]|nr:hypothetical protein [Propionibacteriaceae bacterium]
MDATRPLVTNPQRAFLHEALTSPVFDGDGLRRCPHHMSTATAARARLRRHECRTQQGEQLV